MKNGFKVSLWFTVALVISFLVCTGTVLAKNAKVKHIPHPGGQCYQFVVEDQPATCPNPKSSIWRVETVGAKCNVKVWAAYGDNTLTCDTVKKGSNRIHHKDLGTWHVTGPNGKKLSNALTADTDCDHVWLRFSDDNNCNLRCYINNGRAYCR